MATVTKNRTFGKIAGFFDEKRAITPRWAIRFTSKLQGR
jgi:hypothetical protein